MQISVIIPARNEEEHIGRCLSCLAAQTLPSDQFEVIVVDNGSRDRTRATATSFEKVLPIRILSSESKTVAAVRNCGAAQAASDILVFLDADCYPNPTWLSTGLQLAEKSLVWGAHYTVPADATWVSAIWAKYQAVEIEGEASFIPTSDLFVSRELFLKLNGFDESVATSEDVDFCERAMGLGATVRSYRSLAVCHARSPRNLQEFYRENRWHGTSVIRNFLHNLPSFRHFGVVCLSLYTLLAFWTFILSLVACFWVGPEWAAGAFLCLVVPGICLAVWKTRVSSLRDTMLLAVLYQTYFLSRAAAILRTPQSGIRKVDSPARVVGN